MWNPLVEPLPCTPHGLRCVLALKFLKLFEETHELSATEISQLSLLKSVIHARKYHEAKRRYRNFYTFVEGSEEVELRQSTCHAHCHPQVQQEEGLGEPAHVSEAHDVQDVEESRCALRL
uniref:Protein V2 n=1 Tax=Soybean chlorotic blotch virus TaxID=761702 RepID=M9YWG3_9GEMI|nr:V2 [Soybean chlorotic blotch virus]